MGGIVGRRREHAAEAHEVFQKSEVVESQSLKLNISKAKEKLGFKPLWSSEQAINATFEWYNDYGQKNLSTNEIINKDLSNYLKC